MSLESNSAAFITKYEGFEDKAYWDVNAWRIGHGSDTITNPDGSYRKVVQSDTTTREAAKRDLERRLKSEFIPTVKKQIGEPYWSKLPEKAQVPLISLAYNYGSITKKAIIDTARTGDLKKLSDVIIQSTYEDNKKLSEKMRESLRKRRAEEAGVIASAVEAVKRNKGLVAAAVILITLAILLIVYRKRLATYLTT